MDVRCFSNVFLGFSMVYFGFSMAFLEFSTRTCKTVLGVPKTLVNGVPKTLVSGVPKTDITFSPKSLVCEAPTTDRKNSFGGICLTERRTKNDNNSYDNNTFLEKIGKSETPVSFLKKGCASTPILIV